MSWLTPEEHFSSQDMSISDFSFCSGHAVVDSPELLRWGLSMHSVNRLAGNAFHFGIVTSFIVSSLLVERAEGLGSSGAA